MSVAAAYEWHDGELVVVDTWSRTDDVLDAADSFLVSDGCTIAVDLHYERFRTAVHRRVHQLDGRENLDVDLFWHEALRLIPRVGDWFPRLELRSHQQFPNLVFRLRSAPPRSRSLALATHGGQDPRRYPEVKGPDLEQLLRLRVQAQERGADEVVLVTRGGDIIDGATSAIVWWRDGVFCTPPRAEPSGDFARVDSITVRCLTTLIRDHNIEIREESASVGSTEGAEVWALSALHGIRIATHWVEGPTIARLPGRLELWRQRYESLRRPIEVPTP